MTYETVNETDADKRTMASYFTILHTHKNVKDWE